MGLDLTIKCFLALAISNLSHIMMSKDCAICQGLTTNCIKLYANEIHGHNNNKLEVLRLRRELFSISIRKLFQNLFG